MEERGKKILAAIYARVSTSDQHQANQTMVLKEWGDRLGYDVYCVYIEEDSAWKGNQEALARLVRDAQARTFNVVLVWALDRLSRKGPLEILTLVNKLKQYNVKVLSYQERWTEAPGELADLLYSIVGWVAQMESKRRSERVKAGMDRAKLEGKHVGRPPGSRRRKRGKHVSS